MQPDIILNNFQEIDIHKIKQIPIIAVYNHPTDYPDNFVARLWIGNKPSRYVVLCNNIDELRQSIPPWMQKLMPADQDDPVIIETWL